MPERRGARIAWALGLCAGLIGPGSLSAEPVEGQGPAIAVSIEMAAHRTLLEVMDRAGHRPRPFATDGCSGGLSASWALVADLLPGFAETHEERPPWETCCVVHDRAYHAAGGARTAEGSHRARLEADEALRACVRATGSGRTEHLTTAYGLSAAQVAGAYAAIADAMFDAVRLGGGPCSGLPWRWGYGYPGCLAGN